MITNNSLKEYYTKLHGMYVQCYDMMKAMNQSLQTKDSEISLVVTNPTGGQETLRIPSFLYLESKIEDLSTDFSSIIDLPDSGSAWLQSNSDLYKIEMLKNDVAPVSPIMSNTNLIALYKDNTFIKDLVSPKTYIKINISNMLNIQSSMLMKKIVFYDSDVYKAVSSYTSYEDIKTALYNYTNGTDYEEYESTLDTPIRKNKYRSSFSIVEIPSQEEVGTDNPWTNDSTEKLNYKLKFDTFEYYDVDDSTITYSLKTGDLLSMPGQSTSWKVKSTNYEDMTCVIEEVAGHTALQSVSENSAMVFNIYDKDYSVYHYVEVPLEENQYICVLLANITNNIQSDWSTPLFIDLNSIYVMDNGGNYIKDSYGNKLTYLQYYQEYCVNIGDLILALTETMFPQVSNFTSTQLNNFQNSDNIQVAVSNTFDGETILQVVPINKHLVDDGTNDEIKELHVAKNNYNQQLNTLQANINQIYNTLTTTDFSKETSFTQSDLKNKLTNYYTQRTSLQKQLSSIVDQINTKSAGLTVTGNEVKYRVRGITNITSLETAIESIYDGDNVDIVGLDVEYKYKSTTKDTTSLDSINSSTFTDWNKLYNIDRQREVKISNTGFKVDFVDYNTTDNIVKWNQIDIPIKQGEDVIIRLRYKYSIGQPFFNMYTPWSDEKTVVFPDQYKEDVDLTTILDENSDDTVTSAFTNTLINEGYSEHIQDKIISSDQTFFHMPSSIYSGFNTSENKMISLADKLQDLNSSIETYKTVLDNETNSKFEVYLNVDDKSILLSQGNKNVINLFNNEHISDIFIKKKMNIVIKNTGEVRLNLYSIFPGSTETYMLDSSLNYYENNIGNYERVPILINNEVSAQTLGQWIYFRSNSPWTGETIFYTTTDQDTSDKNAISGVNGTASKPTYSILPSNYIAKDNNQAMLAYRYRSGSTNTTDDTATASVKWRGLKWNGEMVDGFPAIKELAISNSTFRSSAQSIYAAIASKYEDWFLYNSTYSVKASNLWLMRFEDIVKFKADKNETSSEYLSENTTFTDFTGSGSATNFTEPSNFIGGFLYPTIESRETILTEGKEKSSKYVEVGESVSIPIEFEYYTESSNKKIIKSLYFDLRTSLIRDPQHYMIELVGNYDYSSTGAVYSTSSSLSDSATSL